MKQLDEGVGAHQWQISQLLRLAHHLCMTDIGITLHCLPYGGKDFRDLTIAEAEGLIDSLKGILERDILAGGELELPTSRFWQEGFGEPWSGR